MTSRLCCMFSSVPTHAQSQWSEQQFLAELVRRLAQSLLVKSVRPDEEVCIAIIDNAIIDKFVVLKEVENEGQWVANSAIERNITPLWSLKQGIVCVDDA